MNFRSSSSSSSFSISGVFDYEDEGENGED